MRRLLRYTGEMEAAGFQSDLTEAGDTLPFLLFTWCSTLPQRLRHSSTASPPLVDFKRSTVHQSPFVHDRHVAPHRSHQIPRRNISKAGQPL